MPQPVSRRRFLRAASLASAAWLGAPRLRAAPATKRRPPNIVLLYSDDVGWRDLGCYGSRFYETPHLDRLRAQGVRLTDAYSAAGNCAPSRACLLSGQYVPRHGLYTVGGKRRFDKSKRLLKWRERKLLAPENAGSLPADTITIAEALRAAGYACGHFGKWHLGGGQGQSPVEQGFHESVQMAAARHFKIRVKPAPDKPIPPDVYLSDYLTDQAIGFIDRHRDRPFFLYYCDFLVHVPLEGKQALVAKYGEKQPVGGHHHPVYAAMLEGLDRSCGRILARLDALGLAGDTLVLFYSDNGGVASAKDRGLDPEGGLTSVHPLRGTKGMLYEGGIRVPLIARWPGVVKPGSECAVPAHGVDLYPTFLEAAGARPPDGQALDGESLVPILAGKATARTSPDLFWWMPGYLPGRQAPANVIRSGDWKLIENFEDGSLELYNLRDDIGERHNLAASKPDKARELHQRLKQWRQAVGAKVPPRNPDFDPKNEGKW